MGRFLLMYSSCQEAKKEAKKRGEDRGVSEGGSILLAASPRFSTAKLWVARWLTFFF
jgi:hypothetical protein